MIMIMAFTKKNHIKDVCVWVYISILFSPLWIVVAWFMFIMIQYFNIQYYNAMSIGDKNEIIVIIINLAQKKNQWTDYMETHTGPHNNCTG